MENNTALLTLYIPIYNRSEYLVRMLDVFLEDKELFQREIRLVVSDNCSSQDLGALCRSYIDRGLDVHYHRNETNIGGDANIRQGYLIARSKYVWVLGSDDIPVSGFLREMIPLLSNGDYGVFHIAQYLNGNRDLKIYDNGNKFFEDIHVWITFISVNIVATEFVNEADFQYYSNTSFAQMPLYLSAGLSGKPCAVYSCRWIQKGNEASSNGGYNLFDVFVTQYLSILGDFVKRGKLQIESYEKIKRKQLDFLFPYIVRLLIMKKDSNWSVSSGWSILMKHYGRDCYAYWHFILYILKLPVIKIKRSVKRHISNIRLRWQS